jgi:phosphatidylserine/phosphatidylglycerophosphate/cardiolipin synthase-like enzyme
MTVAGEFQVTGQNPAALFTLKIHRGDGMGLLAMNWKQGRPPKDFVGFAIEYMEPGGDRFYTLKNRIAFRTLSGELNPNTLATTFSPIQKFRWVHFPRNAELAGEFMYRVTPVFMNTFDELSYGESQQVPIELRRDTYPGLLNVAFTRGFVSSQAFVDRYESVAPFSTLIPGNADDGLTFGPTHPKTAEALRWMGFEARSAILEVLDKAVADTKAEVRVVAFELNEPEIVSRLEQLGARLKIIIDDSGDKDEAHSAESQAAARLTAAQADVKRQHMRNLQHNKTIVVDGPRTNIVVCGSTTFRWRGLYVQANHAVILRRASAVRAFVAAFDSYWSQTPTGFGATPTAEWTDLGLRGVDARVSFSPHSASNALLATVADDIGMKTTSSLFYSLAFLYQTPGLVLDAIKKVTADDNLFVYGISDRKVGGIDVQKPNGNVEPVFSAELSKNLPAPFNKEPRGGSGIRMHHKFVVIDFDKPTARVYLGSYNFSKAADGDNGEHLLLIRDRRIAVSFMVEALRIFDHYHFRVAQKESKEAKTDLVLRKPPRQPGEDPWWLEHYSKRNKIRDREVFA